MRFLDDIVNEFDIALKTLSNKKSGTGRTYPPQPSEKAKAPAQFRVLWLRGLPRPRPGP